MDANLLQPKSPTQERGRTRVNQIRDHALALLAQEDIDNISISELAKRASVGVGTFYHYYPSKEALVLDLRGLILQETAASLADEFQAPVTTRKAFTQLFKSLVHRWIDALIDVKNLERAVWSYAYKNPQFATALRQQEEGLRALVLGILKTYQDTLRPAKLETVTQSLIIWVDGTMSRILRDATLQENHEWLVDELARMMGHYLFEDGERS